MLRKQVVGCVNVLHNHLDCVESGIPVDQYCNTCKQALGFPIIIKIPESKLVVPAWPHHIVMKTIHLKRYLKAQWLSLDVYNSGTRQTEYRGEKFDAMLTFPIPAYLGLNYGCGGEIPCPDCLEKFIANRLGEVEIDQFCHVNALGTGVTYGRGNVENLRWGMAGDIGTCYTCRGTPELRPEW